MISNLEFVESVKAETIQGGLYPGLALDGVGNLATNSATAKAFTSPNVSRSYQSYVVTSGESAVEVGESSLSEGYAIAALY
jgi:hypothetical protein